MAPLPPVIGVDEPDGVQGLEIVEGQFCITLLMFCGDLECRRGLLVGETGHDMFLGTREWASLEIAKEVTKKSHQKRLRTDYTDARQW